MDAITHLRRRESTRRTAWPGWVLVLLAFFSLIVVPGSSWGQTKFDRDGVTLYWGLDRKGSSPKGMTSSSYMRPAERWRTGSSPAIELSVNGDITRVRLEPNTRR